MYALKNLKLKARWDDAYKKSYYALIDGGKVVFEDMSEKKLSRVGSFYNGRYIYNIESAGHNVGNSCSIMINGIEKAKRKRGFNIVVFDKDRQMVIHSVCFDTHAGTD